jgi:ketosteroid isomerase-like protein
MLEATQASNSEEWQQQIIALEDEAARAFLARDISRLDQLFSDQLIINSPINRVNDKRKVLELLANGVIGHVHCELRHEVFRRDGDLIIVMGSDVVRNAPGDPALLRRVTNIWRKEGDDWKLYIRHATIVGPSQETGQHQ